MKLRNKKTGEIGTPRVVYQELYVDTENGYTYCYKSLQKMCEEWEDYEEPKEHWCITMYGGITRIKDDEEPINDLIEIGNYFTSKEDAYDALYKIKIWKRLKDKGFKFTLAPGVGSLDITPGKFQIEINAEMPEKWFCCDAVEKDLVDCFGGEE